VKRLKTGSFAVLLAACVIGVARPVVAQEGDPERGASLAVTCMGCHGIAGYRNAYPSFRVPKLGGQKPEYIVSALKAYRDGTREHPTMQAQGLSLTDQDIADIAAWVATYGTSRDEVDASAIAGLEAAQVCITCHSPAGANMTPVPPVLSGQHRDYLEHALNRYREGGRGTTVMNAFASALSDEDIRRLAEFWSSRQGLFTLRDGAQTEAP